MRKKLESIKAKQKQKGHVYEMKQLQKRELIGNEVFFVFGYRRGLQKNENENTSCPSQLIS